MNVSSWEDLRLALGTKLKAEGERGFEGLLARLFAADTGQRFYLARTGEQPVGDVYGPLAGVAVQAKRYTAGRFDPNNIEGDIDRALREAPETDIFVVATTRADNQLKVRLEKKTEETGVDLVLLALDDAPTALGALCVTHWGIVREFLPSFDEESDGWASAQANSAAAALAGLRAELSGLPTRRMVSARADAQLRRRLSGGVLGGHAHNRVDLAEAVPRPSMRRLLQSWWADVHSGLGVLEGDEGTGKTWVTADFVSTPGGERPVVLWLDSLAWSRASSIEDIVRAGLEGLFPPGDRRVARIHQKVFCRWAQPILIVLDGANEREAWLAAERLLHAYHQHGPELRRRLRLLFTSRPMVLRARAGRNFWGDARIIRVISFNDEEFAAALAKFVPGITAQDLPDSVRELARVPRYFRLCVLLRERLASFTHVSRELLLWADLEAKLEQRDPQWLQLSDELCGTPSEIVADLAESVGWPEAGATSVATAQLQQHLPGVARCARIFENNALFSQPRPVRRC